MRLSLIHAIVGLFCHWHSCQSCRCSPFIHPLLLVLIAGIVCSDPHLLSDLLANRPDIRNHLAISRTIQNAAGEPEIYHLFGYSEERSRPKPAWPPEFILLLEHQPLDGPKTSVLWNLTSGVELVYLSYPATLPKEHGHDYCILLSQNHIKSPIQSLWPSTISLAAGITGFPANLTDFSSLFFYWLSQHQLPLLHRVPNSLDTLSLLVRHLVSTDQIAGEAERRLARFCMNLLGPRTFLLQLTQPKPQTSLLWPCYSEFDGEPEYGKTFYLSRRSPLIRRIMPHKPLLNLPSCREVGQELAGLIQLNMDYSLSSDENSRNIEKLLTPVECRCQLTHCLLWTPGLRFSNSESYRHAQGPSATSSGFGSFRVEQPIVDRLTSMIPDRQFAQSLFNLSTRAEVDDSPLVLTAHQDFADSDLISRIWADNGLVKEKGEEYKAAEARFCTFEPCRRCFTFVFQTSLSALSASDALTFHSNGNTSYSAFCPWHLMPIV
ncbi:unnamed protein product [Protopolystoma xenopodis]|uniref:Uncharacterized protein n=1 Tax=Protopolystoma xenopodis TaxID=117903 RepID=A0A3S5CCB9_9PLAT|nr:unnamed protein product [Protopolystoma xenopodis]